MQKRNVKWINVDSQALGIGAKYLMWTTYQRIGIIKVSCKSQAISKFKKTMEISLVLVDISIKYG